LGLGLGFGFTVTRATAERYPRFDACALLVPRRDRVSQILALPRPEVWQVASE
jgi:hypothetical protein